MNITVYVDSETRFDIDLSAETITVIHTCQMKETDAVVQNADLPSVTRVKEHLPSVLWLNHAVKLTARYRYILSGITFSESELQEVFLVFSL